MLIIKENPKNTTLRLSQIIALHLYHINWFSPLRSLHSPTILNHVNFYESNKTGNCRCVRFCLIDFPKSPQNQKKNNFMFSSIYFLSYDNPAAYSFCMMIILKCALWFTRLFLLFFVVIVEFSPLHSHASFNFTNVL